MCLDEDLDISIFYDILQRESEDFLAQISDGDDLRRFNYGVENNQKSLELEPILYRLAISYERLNVVNYDLLFML